MNYARISLRKMTSNNINNEDDRKSYEKVGLIYNAIIENKKETCIKKLLQTEGDINYRISEGSRKVPNLLRTTLDIDSGYFNLLLEHGADFTYKNEKSKTIVHTATNAINDDFDTDKKLRHLDLLLDAHVKFNNPSNPSDKYGMTHFHGACMKNNSSAVEFFLKNGVDVNLPINADSPSYSLYTPLHLAVKHACPDAVETLLRYGANIHLKNGAGLTPLHLIIKKKIYGFNDETENEKYIKMFNIFAEFVISNDVTSINDVDDFGFSTFHVHCIILQDDSSLVARIIKQVTNINQQVNFDSPICPGYTPLHFAVFSNVRMFKLLLKNGADVDAKDSKGETPFDLCLQNLTVEEIHSILMAKPEWKNIVLSDNETMLVNVVFAMENMDKFKTFLNNNETALNLLVPFDSPLWPGFTLLHLAVIFNKGARKDRGAYRRKKSEFPLIDQCLKRGADMTIQDAKGSTAIHLAFYMQKENVVQFMLDNYDKPDNIADENNWTFLHIACLVDHEKAVEHLLSNGANVNSQVHSIFERTSRAESDKNFFISPGSTPLHIIVPYGVDTIVEMLVTYGADVNIQDVNGFTPIHRAISVKHCRHKLLLSVKNWINITTSHGLSHLHVASALGITEVIDRLLKLGGDINAQITYKTDVKAKNSKRHLHNNLYGDPQNPLAFLSEYAGYTPLHFACNTNTIYTRSTVLMLIEHGADLYAKNDKEALPLTPWLVNFDQRKVYLEIIGSIVLQKYLEKEYGITTLHIACHYGQLKLAKSLLKEGANVNAKPNSDAPVWQGYTPLHFIMKFACEKYHMKIVIEEAEKIIRLLTKNGADVLSVDNDNDTPIHFIKYLNCHPTGFELKVSAVSSLLTILFENMKNFNVNPVNNQGLSVFHIACLTENMAIIETFLKNGVDVNQAISYFSKICPGSTSLHLIIKQYRELHDQSSKSTSRDKAFLQVVDLILEKGANVNAIDASRNTPLHEAVQMTGLRQILIKKLTSNGADVHVANVLYNTAFEDLLSMGDATWEEIVFFLNAGANFNSYHPISQKGYMAIFLHHHRGIRSSPVLMENHLVLRIINNPKIFEINNSGRTVIHNLVSIKWKKDFLRTCPMLVKLFRRAADLGFGGRKNVEVNDSFYGQMIEQLLIRGCDIDYQDNDGKTALHLAVTFRNNRAITQLLKYGADINLTDRNGKTAFACCREPTDHNEFPWYHKEIDWDSNYANKLFASLVYKLEFCKQPVNEQNKNLQEKVLENSGPMEGESLDCFHNEMLKSKSIKIGNTSLNLYKFLTNEDMPVTYANMTNEERQELDKFSENVDKQNFREIDCLVKWKYRKTIERTRLYEPAVISLNILVNYQLPDVISRIILKFLTNEELKRLIASIN